MYKTLYNEVVYSYTRYICKEYSHINHFARIYIIGLRTLTHVFKFLLLTNINVDKIKNYCVQSYYYYCEFILQIQNNSALNYTDASIFVIKKFINISDPKEPDPILKNILGEIHSYCEIITVLVEKYIDYNPNNINIAGLKPIMELLIPITDYTDVYTCIILIKASYVNNHTFITELTNLLSEQKTPQFKNMCNLYFSKLSKLR